jgi:hypothetical protein
VADALRIDTAVIAEGLCALSNDDNPGRANLYDIGGVTVLLDFAHNPAGLQALLPMAAACRRSARMLVTGQAGDRSDDDIRDFAQASGPLRFDRILIKRMDGHARGRERARSRNSCARLSSTGLPGAAPWGGRARSSMPRARRCAGRGRAISFCCCRTKSAIDPCAAGAPGPEGERLMLTLITAAECFDPAPAGAVDVLVGGGQILALGPGGSLVPAIPTRERVDAAGRYLIPGLVDALTHPCGGGGEGGFANRTPEIDAVFRRMPA